VGSKNHNLKNSWSISAEFGVWMHNGLTTLRAIKKIGNKISNMNIKKQQFIHNINSDRSKTAKIIKGVITQHYINI